MKVEAKLFQYGVLPFALIAAIYAWVTSKSEFGIEPVGVVCLVLLAVMVGMIGGYLGITGRKLDARPEDDLDGEISDAEGDYGFFSPHSWWPLPLAGAALLAFLGLAVGWWVFLIGVIFGIVALLGWCFEYFRGDIGI